ncbi:MAG: Cys-Gln thioester bond-forming surface protein [Clostridia bacterium]|nr:Cys-Gln thioester bond-forming surface protein [Clostridia bacterium]
MKLIKKLGKVLLLLITLISAVFSNFGNLCTKVEAATFFVEEANLKSKGTFTGSITYNGTEIATTYVYYVKDGVEYPAYCISPGADGVGEYGNYTVTVDSLLTDVNLWRVITNGYPYKTPAELGCNSAEEAFTATKHAVYCAIFGREASWYGTIGEKGVRVRNAMAKILSDARSGSSGKPSSNIEINSKQSNWVVDTSLSNCVSQTFGITASTTYNTYSVSLEGNYPEETSILDENNKPKNTFAAGEKFKIAIPMKALNNSGEFRVKVTTKLNTKPVLYGKAPSGTGLQDYALTASIYEDAEGTKLLSYSKNDTKIEILKQDEKTLKPISGVEFRILDSNKKPVYTNLVTNSKGKVTVNNIAPGKYYIEEVKAPDGYVKYDELIECTIEYNQLLTITVNNSLEKKTETEKNVQNINVSTKKEEVEVTKKETNIDKSSKEKSVDILNEEKDISESKEKLEEKESTVISTAKSNATLTKKTNNLNIDNSNKNYNEQSQNEKTVIENQNVNINRNLLEQYLKLYNNNLNSNENIQKLITEILNNNENRNVNIQDEDIKLENKNKDSNTNLQNSQLVVNSNNAKNEGNIQNINQNVNTNVQNSHINLNNQNKNMQKNINTNIASYNGVVKLPKTGM